MARHRRGGARHRPMLAMMKREAERSLQTGLYARLPVHFARETNQTETVLVSALAGSSSLGHTMTE